MLRRSTPEFQTKAGVTTSWALPCTVYPGRVCTTTVVDCLDTYARGVGAHRIRALSIGDVAAYTESSPHRNTLRAILNES